MGNTVQRGKPRACKEPDNRADCTGWPWSSVGWQVDLRYVQFNLSLGISLV